jgi:hypothetical protein
LEQTHIFDAMLQSILDHRVLPINQGAQSVVFPDQSALIPFCWRLEHETQARIGALVFETGKSASPTLKAHAPSLAHTDAIEGAVGAGGERLSQHRIQVLGHPRDPQVSCEPVKGVLGEAVALPQGSEGCLALLGVCAGDGAGHLPVWVSSHVAQAALSSREHGVVELPPGFQVRALACGLTRLDDQGQFEQKRRRLLFGGRTLPAWLGAHVPHQPLSFLKVEHLFQS